MARDERCNGFANYETWLVALWISNDRKRSEHCRLIAKMVAASGKQGRDERVNTPEGRRNILAVNLRSCIEEQSPVRNHTTLYADLMNAALGEVDWYEVAGELMNDIEENATK